MPTPSWRNLQVPRPSYKILFLPEYLYSGVLELTPIKGIRRVLVYDAIVYCQAPEKGKGKGYEGGKGYDEKGGSPIAVLG